MSFDLTILVALGFVGMLAGFVDAIAGGGGLIAIPALLAVGIPPVTAFGRIASSSDGSDVSLPYFCAMT